MIFSTRALCTCWTVHLWRSPSVLRHRRKPMRSGRVEAHVKIVPTLTCARPASRQKAPVKVRGTGVPSHGREVPSP